MANSQPQSGDRIEPTRHSHHHATPQITYRAFERDAPLPFSTGPRYFPVYNRAPCFNQTAKRGQEFADVVEMQARGRFIEDVQQTALLVAGGAPTFACGRLQVRGQLHALRFTTGKSGGRLAQAKISEADFLQSSEFLSHL